MMKPNIAETKPAEMMAAGMGTPAFMVKTAAVYAPMAMKPACPRAS